jgi:DNA-binding MarR family transcriptional regulator
MMGAIVLVQDLKKYLFETLGISIQIVPWTKAGHLPIFLTQLYAFYETSVEGKRCLLIAPKEDSELMPSTLEKHLKKIETKTEDFCLYVFRDISSYCRKWLIAHRIHFIVPGKQMYLPALGLDLREQFRKTRTKKKTQSLSPSAQAVTIYGLLHPELNQIIPAELARKLNYTAMTMTRVLNELEFGNICNVTRMGKHRYINFDEDRRELWEKVKPLMRSPVKKCIWVRLKKGEKFNKTASISGLDALSRQSMLNGPTLPTFAIWEKSDYPHEVPSEEGDAKVELWSYDPMLFAKNGLVDPFSLFLSLRDDKDARTEMALEKIMEKIYTNYLKNRVLPASGSH